jgi:hypothetical protein
LTGALVCSGAVHADAKSSQPISSRIQARFQQRLASEPQLNRDNHRASCPRYNNAPRLVEKRDVFEALLALLPAVITGTRLIKSL